MIIPETLNRADPFEARVAIASALNSLAPFITQDMIVPIFDFLIVREALGDRHAEVRKNMLNAAIALIDLHGAEAVSNLMKMFEDFLGKSTKSKSSSDTDDYIKEAVVIASAILLHLVIANSSFSVVLPVISTLPILAFRKSSTDSSTPSTLLQNWSNPPLLIVSLHLFSQCRRKSST